MIKFIKNLWKETKYLAKDDGGFVLDFIRGAVTVGSAFLGAKSQTKAAQQGSDAQLQAARESIKFQREAFNKSLELQKPFREAGLRATTELESEAERLKQAGLGGGGDELYQFQLKELGKNLARRGFSGASGTALKNEVGLAASEAVRRQGLLNQRINLLQGLAGGGLGISQQLGGQAMQQGANLGNIQTGLGQAQAGAFQQAGQARGAFFSGLGGFANTTLRGLGG